MKAQSVTAGIWVSVLLAAGVLSLGASAPEPQVSSSPAPSPVVSDAPAAAPEKLTTAIAKKLLREFKAAQSSEQKAMHHRHKLELKELKASQSARKNEWDRQEKEARHKFFAEHPRGPDRRGYVRDFIERRTAFYKLLDEELKQRAHEQSVRVGSLKSDQAQRMKEFKEFLDRGEAPPARLWPSAS